MSAHRRMESAAQQLVKAVVMPVLGFAARKYVTGNTLGDAIDLAKRAAAQGLSCTMCYWNDGSEDPAIVAAEYGSIIDYLGQSSLDGALAAKIPALWENEEQVASVVALARVKSVPVIFDAHAPDQSDATLRFLERHGGEGLGLAIPGRWRRSLRDADRAIELGARVRVVKGEWVDPEEPDHGPSRRLSAGHPAVGRACAVRRRRHA